MNTKKTQIPLLKILLILIVTGIIITMHILILFQANQITLDEKKIKTQIAINKLFYSNCISEEFATLTPQTYTQKNLDKCFSGSDDTLLIATYIYESDYSTYDSIKYILNKENEFKQKRTLCSLKSNILCTEMRYPITYLNENGKREAKFLTVQIIAQ